MSIYEEAPAADPRALLSAAALGSIAGLVLGGGYLLAGKLGSAPSTFVTASAPAFVSPVAPSIALPAADASPVAASMARPPSPPQLRSLHFAAPPFRPVGDDTDRERRCLTQAVYYEARGEAAAGQQAVAQVVLNRVRHPAFPKSVCGVVFQQGAEGCQFSFACAAHTEAGRDVVAWRRAQTVADRALDGFVMRQVGEATHFHVSSLAVDWSQGLARVAQVGAHVFYGLTGRSERPAQGLHVSPTQEARAANSSAMQPVAASSIDQRVHLVLTSEPVAASPPTVPTASVTAARLEPASTAGPVTKLADVVAPPTASVVETR